MVGVTWLGLAGVQSLRSRHRNVRHHHQAHREVVPAAAIRSVRTISTVAGWLMVGVTWLGLAGVQSLRSQHRNVRRVLPAVLPVYAGMASIAVDRPMVGVIAQELLLLSRFPRAHHQHLKPQP